MTEPLNSSSPDRNGPYSADLAEAFRAGARSLCEAAGDSFEVLDGARVAEGPDGGVYVDVRLFVSDGERPLTPSEAAEAEQTSRD